MHKARQRQKIDTRGVQLRRAVRNAINWLNSVQSVAVVRFFKRHVVELEKKMRMGNQHGFFQNIKSVQLEETRKVEPQYVCDKEGRLLWDKGRIRERWVRFFHLPLSAKYNMLGPDMPKELRQQPVASALGRDDCHSDQSNGKRESSGAGRPSVGKPKTWTSVRPDHPAGALPTFHPYLAQGESPTAMERRGHYRTPHERAQDGMRKLPRHIARGIRG